MTFEEALKTLDVAIVEVEWEYSMEYAVALEMAKEALEKQIQKKPIQDDCALNIYYCPSCKRWFNGYHKPHHCVCGQALVFGGDSK